MKALVIGGGIGGLALAAALRARDIEAPLYEAAREPGPAGAGIVVATNGMLALRRISPELERAVGARGHRLDVMQLVTARKKVLQTIDAARAPSYTFHRAELHDALVAGLSGEGPRFGKRLVDFDEESDGVIARFADGTTARGDFLVGADGLRSAVRAKLFPGDRLRYAGQTSWRGVCDAGATVPEHTSFELWGRGTRFGAVRLTANRVYWYAVVNAPSGGRENDVATLHRRFDGYHAMVHELIDRAGPTALRTDIHDLRHLPAWHRGRVLLLGDAAHATTPNLGQGGNQALEDAACLALQLETKRSVGEAFAAHERLRRAKARRVVDESWRLGKVGQLESPLLVRLRDVALRLAPAGLLERRTGWLARLDF